MIALDLRVLTAEINEFLQRFHQSFPGGTIRCLRLTGINSAHPLLVDLLSDALDIPVEAYRPLLAPGIAGFKADDLLVQANLGRLAGLALSLLTNDELISCHKDGMGSSWDFITAYCLYRQVTRLALVIAEVYLLSS